MQSHPANLAQRIISTVGAHPLATPCDDIGRTAEQYKDFLGASRRWRAVEDRVDAETFSNREAGISSFRCSRRHTARATSVWHLHDSCTPRRTIHALAEETGRSIACGVPSDRRLASAGQSDRAGHALRARAVAARTCRTPSVRSLMLRRPAHQPWRTTQPLPPSPHATGARIARQRWAACRLETASSFGSRPYRSDQEPVA